MIVRIDRRLVHRRHDGRTARRTNRRGREAARGARAFCCKMIEVWRLNLRRAVTAQLRAQVIGDDPNDIGAGVRFCGRLEYGGREDVTGKRQPNQPQLLRCSPDAFQTSCRRTSHFESSSLKMIASTVVVISQSVSGVANIASGPHTACKCRAHSAFPSETPPSINLIMKRFVGVAAGLLCLLTFSSCKTASKTAASQTTPDPIYDTIIRNGRIVDGSGNPAFFGRSEE